MSGAIEYAHSRTPEDEAQVREFYGRMFPTSPRLIQLFDWRRNAVEQSGGIHTFVARLEGQIVGAMNLVPFSLQVGDRILKAAWQQDSIVDKAMRGKGVGRELINGAARDFDCVCGKGTSDAMYALRKSCGFHDVVNSNYLIKVLSPTRFGDSAKHLAYGIWLGARSLVARRHVSHTPLPTKELNRFGDEFDDPPSGDEHPVRPIKTSGYLNWRYGRCPVRKYQIIGTTGRDGRAGAAVLTVQRTAWVVDLICDTRDTDSLTTLVQASVEESRRSGSASVHTFATSRRVRQCLIHEGFVEVSSTPRFTYRLSDSGVGGTTFEVGTDWAFYHGDGDNELYD